MTAGITSARARFLPAMLAEDRKRAGWSAEQAARWLGVSQASPQDVNAEAGHRHGAQARGPEDRTSSALGVTARSLDEAEPRSRSKDRPWNTLSPLAKSLTLLERIWWEDEMGEDERMDRKALAYVRDGRVRIADPEDVSLLPYAVEIGRAAATQPTGPPTRMYSRGEEWLRVYVGIAVLRQGQWLREIDVAERTCRRKTRCRNRPMTTVRARRRRTRASRDGENTVRACAWDTFPAARERPLDCRPASPQRWVCQCSTY